MPPLPTGTVTFLFTDIEGSTRLLQHLGDTRAAEVFEDHRRLLRDAFAAGNGHELQDQGDGFLVVFQKARDAILTAVAAQNAINTHPWPEGAELHVRMGLHTGEPVSAADGYVGLDVNRAARICSVGHGGQILLSQTTRDLVERDLPADVSLRDLGAHRLKDLQRPEKVFHLLHLDLPVDFPPLKSLDHLPNNLPIQLTSFIGREREMAEVKRLMGSTRLLTLTGTGGSGKTRLALQVASDLLDDFADGVWVADLAPFTDPALVPQAVASALNVREQPGRELMSGLVDYIQPKQMLLTVDNCEHLVAACITLTDTLLRTCPSLRILATSREGLGIAGETAFPVPALSLPDLQRLPPLDSLREYEAVRLFIDRATAALPAFRVTDSNGPAVAQVCHRLDGIPLAIELAAARVKVLSPEEIVERLDDRFRLLTGGSRAALPRHQTLQAAMDWSYDLLSEEEQVLLRRLGVFAGGFTLEAAESICAGEDVAPHEVLDLLTRLVDKSLVMVQAQNGHRRYRLLDTVRQYSRSKLSQEGEEDALLTRHRDWYLGLAERAEPEVHGPEQQVWLERLETEHDNLQAALEWSQTAEGSVEAGLRLAGALWWFWEVRGHYSEGRRWLEGALAGSTDAPGPARAKVLYGAGFLTWDQGDYKRASALCEESLTLCRELKDKRGVAFSLLVLGFVAGDRRATALLEESLSVFREAGDRWGIALALFNLAAYVIRSNYGRARALLEESLSVFREIGDRWGIAFTLGDLGSVLRDLGDYARATGLLEESLALRRELGDKWGIADALNNLGRLARYRGEYARAAALHEESLALFRELGARIRIPGSLRLLGLVAHDQGDDDRATAFFDESLALSRELGIKSGIAYALGDLGMVTHHQGDHERASALLTESLKLLLEIGDKRRITWSFEQLAGVARTLGSFERAARLLGAAEVLREAIGVPVAPPDRGDYDRNVTAAREALGEEAFATAWTEGRAMALDQAVAYALQKG